ncbi:hypothetical protein [Novosphingobium sp. B 225]|uniref:hypothetical protein n=1 Tax=Novosphingobium sp. B 225 TaxID=1961849 RepID=UPI000B4AAACE|nr:hypothetical protein [Novosphingobium sp. B 225]
MLSKPNAMLAAVAALSAMLPSPVLAATQGSLGATSTGTISISASVPARARLSGLADVAFTSVDPTTAASNAQSVCAWSNTATKGYTITASGSGAANAFTLANASLTVPYSVQWNATAGQTSGTGLTAGTASAGFVSTATNQNCASGPASSASLIIGIAASDLQTMQAATSYTGTLTLLMTPQ